jgi:hypothetical protein
MKPWLFNRCVALLWTLLLLFCELSFGDRSHQICSNPSVFADAEVNLVVLPYVSVGGSKSSLDDIGQRLALIVKLDTFAHVLEYGSLGATQMEVPQGADPDTCLPQVVIPKLLGQTPGADVTAEKGKGLIIVWGVLYEEDDDVVIQSYARFLRRDTSESLSFSIDKFNFMGQPSSQVVAFAPRAFKKSLLSEIENSYQRADFVHKEPKDDSEGEPLPRPVAKCISCRGELTPGFQVQEYKGEWIHVRWIDPISRREREGCRYPGQCTARTIAGFLPEIAGQRHQADHGASHAGEKNCSHYADSVEKGRKLRR